MMKKAIVRHTNMLVVGVTLLMILFCSLLCFPANSYAALVAGDVSSHNASSVETASAKKPAKATITSLKSATPGKATIKVRTVSGASGYQYRVALNKAMTKSVKSKTITKSSYTFSGLSKGKTYYAKVRAYKISKGKKVWGPWSIAKSVKVKAGNQPADGYYVASIDIGGATARISGSTLTVGGGINYHKNLESLASGGGKKLTGSKTFALSSKTRFGIDDTDAGILRIYTKTEFAKLLNSKSEYLPFIIVEIKSGKAVFVGTLWV